LLLPILVGVVILRFLRRVQPEALEEKEQWEAKRPPKQQNTPVSTPEPFDTEIFLFSHHWASALQQVSLPMASRWARGYALFEWLVTLNEDPFVIAPNLWKTLQRSSKLTSPTEPRILSGLGCGRLWKHMHPEQPMPDVEKWV